MSQQKIVYVSQQKQARGKNVPAKTVYMSQQKQARSNHSYSTHQQSEVCNIPTDIQIPVPYVLNFQFWNIVVVDLICKYHQYMFGLVKYKG
jgi:hypothetical protein